MSDRYYGPGSEGKIIVAAGAVISDSNGRVLLVRHRPERKGFWAGKWICPGGKVEPGESLDEAAAREVMEETGLKLQIDSWLPPFERIVREAEHVRMHVIYLDCVGTAEGEPIPGDDVGEAEWFTETEILQMFDDLHEDTRKLLFNAKIIRKL